MKSIFSAVHAGLYSKKYNIDYTFLLHIRENPCILLFAVA